MKNLKLLYNEFHIWMTRPGPADESAGDETGLVHREEESEADGEVYIHQQQNSMIQLFRSHISEVAPQAIENWQTTKTYQH
ncbi:hypothetical protein EMCRGX_G017351 [Ephydatia muelleri]